MCSKIVLFNMFFTRCDKFNLSNRKKIRELRIYIPMGILNSRIMNQVRLKPALNQLMKSSSRYLGSGHMSLSTTSSSLSMGRRIAKSDSAMA